MAYNDVYFGDSPTFRRNISPPPSRSKNKPNSLPASTGFRFGLLFSSEDVGDMFLRNVVLSLNYVALGPISVFIVPAV
jgi:hypothetical protein